MSLSFNNRYVISNDNEKYKIKLSPTASQVGKNNNSVVDDSGNNIPLTLLDTANQGPFSPEHKNWSVYISDTSSYIGYNKNSAGNFGSADFTIEMWINPLPFTSTSMLVDTRSTTSISGWTIHISQVGIVLTINSSFTITISKPPVANTWSHIAFSRANGMIRGYLNGKKLVETYSSASFTSNSIRIGYKSYTASTALGYKGYISNFRIIIGTGIYNSDRFNLPKSNLMYYPGTSLLMLQHNRLYDQSTSDGQSYTITPSGNVNISTYSPYNNDYIPKSSNVPYLVSDTTPFNNNVSWVFKNNGYLTIPNQSELRLETANDWTFECYLYTDSFNNIQRIAGTMPSSRASGWAVDILTDKTIRFSISNYLNNISTIAIDEGVWNHIAIVRSNTTLLTLFINGNSAGTFSIDDSIVSSQQIMIGGSSEGYNFTGYISNLRVSNISGIYRIPFFPKNTHLDSNSDTLLMLAQLPTFKDNSTYLLNITVVGDVTISGAGPFKFTNNSFVSNTGSLYFNGTQTISTDVNSNFNFGSSDYTIEMWVYITLTTSTASSLVVVSNTSWAKNIRLGFTTSGAMELEYPTGPTFGISALSTTSAKNKWIHLALVRNNQNVKVFVNGRSAVSYNDSGYDIRDVNFTFGQNIKGYMSNIRVLNGIAAYSSDSAAYTTDNTLESVYNKVVPNKTSLLLNFNNHYIYDNLNRTYNIKTHNVVVTDSVLFNNHPTYHFQGNGYLELSENFFFKTSYNSFKVEINVMSTFRATTIFVGVYDSTASYWYLGMTSSGNLVVKAGSWSVSTTSVIPLNQWTKLSLTMSATSATAAVNDVPVASTNSYTQPSISATAPITIGATAAKTFFMQGYVGSVRVIET